MQAALFKSVGEGDLHLLERKAHGNSLAVFALFPPIFSQISFGSLSSIALRETFHHGRGQEACRCSTVVPLARARYDKRRQMVNIQARHKHSHVSVPRTSFFSLVFLLPTQPHTSAVVAPELLLTKPFRAY